MKSGSSRIRNYQAVSPLFQRGAGGDLGDDTGKIPLSPPLKKRGKLSNKGDMNMLPEKQKKAYEDFYESASHNDILDSKTTVMIQMATAMALGCYP